VARNPVTLCSGEFSKATRSGAGGGDCVEYSRKLGKVFLRDSKEEFGSADDRKIVLAEQMFDAFQADVRAGNITAARGLSVVVRGDGMYVFRDPAEVGEGTELVFDQGEVDAFVDGICKGEFDNESTHADHMAECAHREVELTIA
jgi:hypothetical protein